MDAEDLLIQVDEFFATQHGNAIPADKLSVIAQALPELRERAKTLPKLLESAHFILSERPFTPDEKAAALLDPVCIGMLKRLTVRLQHVTWTATDLEEAVKDFAASEGLKLGQVAQPLFNVMVILGREESIARLMDASGSAE